MPLNTNFALATFVEPDHFHNKLALAITCYRYHLLLANFSKSPKAFLMFTVIKVFSATPKILICIWSRNMAFYIFFIEFTIKCLCLWISLVSCFVSIIIQDFQCHIMIFYFSPCLDNTLSHDNRLLCHIILQTRRYLENFVDVRYPVNTLLFPILCCSLASA